MSKCSACHTLLQHWCRRSKIQNSLSAPLNFTQYYLNKLGSSSYGQKFLQGISTPRLSRWRAARCRVSRIHSQPLRRSTFFMKKKRELTIHKNCISLETRKYIITEPFNNSYFLEHAVTTSETSINCIIIFYIKYCFKCWKSALKRKNYKIFTCRLAVLSSPKNFARKFM
jgi:hypothetical protein